MADYTLSARGTYDGSNFDRGISQSGSKLDGFKDKCSAIPVALGNVLANAVSAVGSAVSSSVDAAVSRVDTMNNFSKVMENMGISAEAAQESIDTLSGDALKGLPTTLDSAVAGVQRLTSKNQDIGKSTDYFLAMNNAIVAGGTDMGVQQSAIEQLSQAYSKGKMDMQEWRTLQMAMPAQLNQVAKAMGMTADELGEGLRKGDVSMDSFMDTLVKLNKEGVEGFASLEEQARSATGGIATQMTNLNTAVARAVANVIDKFNESGAITKALTMVTGAVDSLGKKVAPIAEEIGGRFSSALDAFSEKLGATGDPLKAFDAALSAAFKGTPVEPLAKAIGTFAKSVSADIQALMPFFKAVASAVREVGGVVLNVVASMAPVLTIGAKAGVMAAAVVAAITKVTGAVKAVKSSMALAVTSLNPAAAAITAVVAVANLLAVTLLDAAEKQKTFEKGTSGLVDSVKSLGDESSAAASGISSVGAAADGSSGSVRGYAMSVDDLIQKNGELADSINQKFSDVNSDNAALQAYADKIAELAGNCDGSSDKVDELKAAVDGYNGIAGTSYQVTDDFSGALNANTDEILKNAEAFKVRAKAAAAQEALTDLYKQQFEAEKTLAEASDNLAKAQQDLADAQARGDVFFDNPVPEALAEYNKAVDGCNALTESIEYMGGVVVESTAELRQYASDGIGEAISANDSFKAKLSEMGVSAEDAASRLGSLGFTAESAASLTEEQFAAMAGSAGMSLGEVAAKCDELGIEMPSALRGAITASAAVMDAGGSEAAQAWVTGMTAEEYEAVNAASQVAGKSTAEFVAQAEKMGSAGKDDVVAYARGILSGKPSSDAAASTTAKGASSSLQSGSDGSTAGENLSDTFRDHIDTAIGNANARLMASNAVSAAEGVDASNIGSYFSQGAANGINVTAMVGNAVKMVKNAIDAANATAETGSPSKVMRRFGGYFAQGAAIGVENDAHLMADNAAAMVRNAVSSARRVPLLNMGTLGLSGFASVRASSGLNRSAAGGSAAQTAPAAPNVTIYIDYKDGDGASGVANEIANRLTLLGFAGAEVSYG